MFDTIKNIIVDMLTIDESEITKAANLRDDLDMSSLDLINLAVELEKEFSVNVSNRTIIAAHTVNDVIQIIEKETKLRKVSIA